MANREIQSVSYQKGVDKYLISPEDRVILDQLDDGFFKFGYGIQISNAIHDWRVLTDPDSGDLAIQSGRYGDVYPFIIEAGAKHDLLKLLAEDDVEVNGNLWLSGDFYYGDTGIPFVDYVRDLFAGLDWQESVLTVTDKASAVEAEGNRYIASVTSDGWTADYIYEWEYNHETEVWEWLEIIPNNGYALLIEDVDEQWIYNEGSWVRFGTTVPHNSLAGRQGGLDDSNINNREYYHLNLSEYTELTQWIDSVTLGSSGSVALPNVNFTVLGSVGIGTASPSEKVHIYAADPTVRIQSSAGSYMDLNADASNSYIDYGNILRIRQGTSDRVTVLANGNVGINDTTPSEKLDVNGNIQTTGYINGTATDFILRRQGSDHINLNGNVEIFKQLIFNSDLPITINGSSSPINSTGNQVIHADGTLSLDSGGMMTLDPTSTLYIDGNVGIGTSSPDRKLHVMESAVAGATGYTGAHLVVEANGNSGINILTPNTGVGGVYFGDPEDNDNAYIRYTHSSNVMELGTYGGSRVTINSVGDFGIGINPSYKLDVNGTMRVEGQSTFKSPIIINDGAVTRGSIQGATGNMQINAQGSGGDLWFRTWVDILLDPTGNVGIGTTTPLVKLHVNAAASTTVAALESSGTNAWLGFKSGASASIYQVMVGSEGDDLLLRSGGSTRMRINSLGNVGIGISTPNERLHVNGGNVRVNGRDYKLLLHPDNDASYLTYNDFICNTSTSYMSMVNNGNGGIKLNAAGGGNIVLEPGNVGIGITPLEKLHVNGNVRSDNVPVYSYHLTNKAYVDGLVQGLDWQESVIAIASLDPGSPVIYTTYKGTLEIGDRYIAIDTYGAWTEDYIYEWNIDPVSGSPAWIEMSLDKGTAVWLEQASGGFYEGDQINWNGTVWVRFSTQTYHNTLYGLQGGSAGEYYHMTNLEYNSGNWGSKNWTTTGNIGVGNHSPIADLEVYGTTPVFLVRATLNNSATIRLSESVLQQGGRLLYNGTDNVFSIGYSYSSTDYNTINIPISGTYAGMVGIGTEAPEVELHIGPSALSSGIDAAATTLAVSDITNGAQLVLRGLSPKLFFDITGGGNPMIFQDTSNLEFYNGTPDSPANLNMVIKNGGFVGIGVADPLQKLHVNGNINIVNGSDIRWNNGDARIWEDAYALKFDTWNSGLGTKMTILSNGNVGIGWTSPTAKLHLDGHIYAQRTSGAAGLHLRSSDALATSDPYIRMDSGSTRMWLIYDDISDSNKLKIQTSESLPVDALTIDQSARVGVGTTTPATKLEVMNPSVSDTLTEAFRITGGYYSGEDTAEAFKFFHQTAVLNTNRSVAFKSINGSLHIQTIVTSTDVPATASRIVLQPDGGNVGIGTTSAGNLLTLGSSSPRIGLDADNKVLSVTGSLSPGSAHGAYINLYGETHSTNPGDLHLLTGASGEIVLHTASGSPRMYIKNDGKIGVGTSDPDVRLHVSDPVDCFLKLTADNDNTSADCDAGIIFEEDNTTIVSKIFYNQSSNVLSLGHGSNEHISIQSDGTIGINTTSLTNGRLVLKQSVNDSNGGIRVVDASANDFSGRIYMNSAADFCLERAGNPDQLVLDNGGNVGIGLNTPSQKLHINGNLRVDGTIVLEKNALIKNVENTDVDTGTEDIDSFSETAGDACVWHYVIKNGTNVRAGTVTACWITSAATVKYKESFTEDIGDTSGVSLTVESISDVIRLRATVTSDNWEIRVIRNMI